MQLAELDYQYPEDLVATEPKEPCRILYGNECREILKSELLEMFQPGDVLVVNDTQVEKRRVFSDTGLEFLFLNPLENNQWEVLFPARTVSDSELISLPGGVEAKLQRRGLPQIVQLNQAIDFKYFQSHGELALPPYIQKARGERRNIAADESWYQTDWANVSGSAACPTASLHFSKADLELLESKAVSVNQITLHVGMGTFLPIKTENLKDHLMHSEAFEIPDATLAAIEKAKSAGNRVWALGTTSARALESYGQNGKKSGDTDLFIQPGFQWSVVDNLLTNFHQPKSTLLCLVAAFAGNLDQVKLAYEYAIEKEFRLFSYGDLSLWTR